GPAVASFGDRVVVIPASGLDTLASAVLEATRDIGSIDPRPFNGHLTLARTKNGVACPLVGRRFIAEFTAVAIELVASDNDGAGSRHRRLATWPLSRPELEQP
ncbi:MAG: 2'-5' RNA ligase family protein, partial [Acidimicrobiales bacterium]